MDSPQGSPPAHHCDVTVLEHPLLASSVSLTPALFCSHALVFISVGQNLIDLMSLFHFIMQLISISSAPMTCFCSGSFSFLCYPVPPFLSLFPCTVLTEYFLQFVLFGSIIACLSLSCVNTHGHIIF